MPSSPGEISPRLNRPLDHRAVAIVAPAESARGVGQHGSLCTGPVTAAGGFRQPLEDAVGTNNVPPTGDENFVVAIYADIGDAVVDGCGAVASVIVHVARRGPTELLGAVDEKNAAPAVHVFQFGSCEVDFLPWLVALLLFTEDHDGFCSIGRRRMFTMLAQLSPIAGDRPSREATPPSGRGERKAGLPERKDKVGALWAGRPSLDGHIQRRRVIELRDLAE